MLDRGGKGKSGVNPPASFEKTNVDERLYLGTIEKGMLVLDTFCSNPRPMTLAEVSEASGLNKSATQRVLYTLRALRYLTHSETTRQYSLSVRAMDIGNAYLRSNPIVEATFPYLLEANKRSQETANLTELDGSDIVFISRVPSRSVMSSYVTIGTRLPAFATAPGRAILANLDPSVASEILKAPSFDALTPFTIQDRSKLLDELDNVRKKGFAIANQEAMLGDISIAAPIFGYDNRVVAAVNIAVSTANWTIERVEAELSPITVEIARQMSKVASQYRRA
ncbi:helix-turn-helix domain-containing protein [Rhizobium leguminosarum]|uniref:IclR family transcriptional regulator n=1 Tax=Rhizobium ruizarguesonis TaxID=2081791 RepID=UPI001A9937D3|nr:IclR family transcriptional regulator C-terminal domain-containing protein [Rhizobium ruizarguesonis]MBY5890780.1 helix-turn-helix domain-containing protein [Rhizobium leguminosarum]QSZ05384.1 helix-turn-helix domain-containing protein [Rhizobium ruizarguesonis]